MNLAGFESKQQTEHSPVIGLDWQGSMEAIDIVIAKMEGFMVATRIKVKIHRCMGQESEEAIFTKANQICQGLEMSDLETKLG